MLNKLLWKGTKIFKIKQLCYKSVGSEMGLAVRSGCIDWIDAQFERHLFSYLGFDTMLV